MPPAGLGGVEGCWEGKPGVAGGEFPPWEAGGGGGAAVAG